MTRVFLTGGSGFIAAHVLDTLLARGHSVVTSVRTASKARNIIAAHPKYGRDKLDVAIVEDISKEGAFDKAVVSEPPFEAVIHTASPYHFNLTDREKIQQMLDTAIIGTTGILKAIKKNAHSVKRVVITSSFAAVVDPKQKPGYVFSEKDFNPITEDEAYTASNVYRASKTFAERAAWNFVKQEKPNFSLVVCNPPMVFGPIVHYLNSLDAVNTSNQRIRDMITGAVKEKCPPTANFNCVDVRDVALAHVLAMEKEDAAGHRFAITQGSFCNREIVEIIAKAFPEYKARLPEGDALIPGDYPEGGVYGYDNTKSKKELGLTYRPLKDTIIDCVKSMRAVGVQ